jgi:ketosteroid isomerase-like protein
MCSTNIILAGLIAAALCAPNSLAASDDTTAREILALEHRIMDGWFKGDPDPFLALADSDITYFHIMTASRLDGLPAVRTLVEPYRGKPLFDSYEINDAKVQAAGDMAVLTYNYVTHNGAATRRWNATQVYQRKQSAWRLIHSHFSATLPPQQP